MAKGIEICMKCGSKNLEFEPGGAYAAQTEFGISNLSGKALCKDCGNFGLVVEMKNEKDRLDYVKMQKKGKK